MGSEDENDPVTAWRSSSRSSYVNGKTSDEAADCTANGGVIGTGEEPRRQAGGASGGNKGTTRDLLLEDIDRHLSIFDGQISPINKPPHGDVGKEEPPCTSATSSKESTEADSSSGIFEYVESRSMESGAFDARQDYADLRDSPPASSSSLSSSPQYEDGERAGMTSFRSQRISSPNTATTVETESVPLMSPRNYGQSEYFSPPSSFDDDALKPNGSQPGAGGAVKKADGIRRNRERHKMKIRKNRARAERQQQQQQQQSQAKDGESESVTQQASTQQASTLRSPGKRSLRTATSRLQERRFKNASAKLMNALSVHTGDSPHQKQSETSKTPLSLPKTQSSIPKTTTPSQPKTPISSNRMSSVPESPQVSVQTTELYSRGSLFDDSDSFAESTIISEGMLLGTGTSLVKVDENEDLDKVMARLEEEEETEQPAASVTSPSRRRNTTRSARRTAILTSVRQRQKWLTKTSSADSSTLFGMNDIGDKYEMGNSKSDDDLSALLNSNEEVSPEKEPLAAAEATTEIAATDARDDSEPIFESLFEDDTSASSRSDTLSSEARDQLLCTETETHHDSVVMQQASTIYPNQSETEESSPLHEQSPEQQVTKSVSAGSCQSGSHHPPEEHCDSHKQTEVQKNSSRCSSDMASHTSNDHLTLEYHQHENSPRSADMASHTSHDHLTQVYQHENSPRSADMASHTSHDHLTEEYQHVDFALTAESKGSQQENDAKFHTDGNPNQQVLPPLTIASKENSHEEAEAEIPILPSQVSSHESLLHPQSSEGSTGNKENDQQQNNVSTCRNTTETDISSPRAGGLETLLHHNENIQTPSTKYNMKAFEFETPTHDSSRSMFDERADDAVAQGVGSPETQGEESAFTAASRDTDTLDFETVTKQAGVAVLGLRSYISSFMCGPPVSDSKKRSGKTPLSMFNSSYAACAPNQGSAAKKEWNKSVKDSLDALAKEGLAEPLSPTDSKKGVYFNDEADKSALQVRRAKRMLDGKQLRACPSNQLIDKEFVNMLRVCDKEELSAIVTGICNDKNDKYKTVMFSQHDPSSRDAAFKALTYDRLNDLNEEAKVALIKVLANDNNHAEAEDFMSRLWISISQPGRTICEKDLGIRTASWARRCCSDDLNAFPKSLWRRPGRRERKCLVADDTKGLPSRVQDDGEKAIEELAQTILSYFPYDGNGVDLVGSPVVNELVVELGLTSLNDDINWEEADQKYPDVSTFVNEVAHRLKQNPILITFGAAWRKLDTYSKQEFGPEKSDHMEADVRFSVAYCFLQYVLCKTYLSSPRACDCYEGDKAYDYETVMASEQRSFLDKLLYAMDVKARDEQLRSKSWESSLFEKNRMDIFLRYMHTVAQPMKAGGSDARDTVRQQKSQSTTIPFTILETMCECAHNGSDANATAGFELFMEPPFSRGDCDKTMKSGDTKEWIKNSSRSTTRYGVLLFKPPFPRAWNNLFDSWSLASASIYPDAIDHFAPLLAPVLCDMRPHEKDGLFLSARFLGMQLHMHYLMCARTNLNSSSTTSTDFRNDVATQLLGLVNQEAAEQYHKLVDTVIEEEGGTASVWKHEAKRLGLQSLWATLKVAIVGMQGVQGVPEDALRLLLRLQDMVGEWGEEKGLV